MIKLACLLLVVSLVSGQLTLTGSLGVVYGTVDTLETAVTSVKNFFNIGDFRGDLEHGFGNPDNPYGLGITDVNADGEYRGVWIDLDHYYDCTDIAGLENVTITSVNPYCVALYETDTTRDDFIICMQVTVNATIVGFLPYIGTLLFPLSPKDDNSMYVALTNGGNSYQYVDRTQGSFLSAISLLGFPQNTAYAAEYRNVDGEKVGLLDAWLLYVYD